MPRGDFGAGGGGNGSSGYQSSYGGGFGDQSKLYI